MRRDERIWLRGYARAVVVVDFNYLPRGLTGNERTGKGYSRSYWLYTCGRKPGTSGEARRTSN